MAKKTMKFKEADPMTDPITGNQIVDQNAPAAAPVPATNEEVAQATDAAPVLADPVMPNDGSEPIDEPVDNGIQVNPETVGVEVQIPTDQLAQAVAQATGDVSAAEMAPDAMAAQEDELVAEQPTDEVSEAPVEAPAGEMTDAGVAPQQEQVLESCGSKKKVEESESSEVEAKMEGDLERIITTGVENIADGLSNGKATIDSESKENELDIITNGVKQTAEGLKESEESGDEDDDEEEVSEGPEEKLDFSKLASDVDDEDLPPAMNDTEGLDIDDEVDPDIFEDVDIDEDAVNDFMAKMDNFLKDEDKAEEVADSLRVVADVIEDVAEEDPEDILDSDDEESEEDFEDEEEEDFEPVDNDKFDFDSLLSGAYDSDDEESEEDFEDEEFGEDDEIEESLVRVPCKFPKNRINSIKESKRPPVQNLSESYNGIKFPAGSDPMVEKNQNLVEAHDRVVKARREAIANFRESIRKDNDSDVRDRRFNEALRSSVRMTEREYSKNSNSWSNNQFYDKYEESSKLDFKTLLKNGYLG